MCGTLWCVDCTILQEIVPGETEHKPNPKWKRCNVQGKQQPGSICKHTMSVHENKALLFGGLLPGDCQNTDMYRMDLDKFCWTYVPQEFKDNDPLNNPGPREEHTAIAFGNHMIIFGGFN